MKKFLSLLMIALVVVLVTGCGGSTTTTGTTGSTSGSSSDTGPETFTYNVFIPGMPTTFNVHTWETNDDSFVITYTEMGLYDFKLNENNDGYVAVPEMAAGEPVDVTAEYAGNPTYGIPADAEGGYAFKIALNPDAEWANGVAINADTYIYSMQQQLNPEMQNRRADSYYTGIMVLANSEEYLKQGQTTFVTLEKYMSIYGLTDLQTAIDHATTAGVTTRINWAYSFGYANFDPSAAAENKVVATTYTLRELYDLYKAEVLELGWTDAAGVDEWVLTELYVDYTFPTVPWENVGLKKTGDYEITLVLSKPITNFYLKYTLSSNWIVYEELYEAGKEDLNGLIVTDYGTSVESYMSYGPYKLTSFQDDKVILMEKNDNWYGYTDGNHVGQYQTTHIRADIVAEHNTALMMFLQGSLDEIGLENADVPEFRFSENLMTVPQTYTSKVTLNTDLETLRTREQQAGANIDKEIFTILEFRKAISYALDRQNFVQTQTAGSAATVNLLNSLYIANVETGEPYIYTDKFVDNVLVALYGTEFPTGYDKEYASQLFQEAYDKAVELEYMDENDVVEIVFSVYLMDSAYTDKVVWFQKALDAATVGTDLEDRINFDIRVDADYYESSEKGDFDMIWTTWGGNPMDPFGFMSVYTVNPSRNEYGWDPAVESFAVTIDGVEITKTYNDWYTALNDGEYNAFNADYETRLEILSQFEYNFIQTYVAIPVYTRTTVMLKSDKITYGVDSYIPLVTFGGVRHMTYNYNDVEWANYIKDGIDYTD